VSTTHTLVFTLQLSTPIEKLNVFDIGLNKKRVNADQLYHAVEKNVPNRIKQLERLLSRHKKRVSFNLAIPGFLLKLLKERHHETFNILKRIVVEHKPEFLLTTYYNSSLHVLSDQEITRQLIHEQDLLKECFNTQASLFFAHEHALSKSLSQALRKQKIKGIVFANSSTVLPVNYTNTSIPVLDAFNIPDDKPQTQMTVISLAQLGNHKTQSLVHELFSQEKLITCSTIFSSLKSRVMLKAKQNDAEFTPLEQHLIKELKSLYPHVIMSGDDQLIAHWRLLANTNLIQQADYKLASQDYNPYEHYTHFMHLLNDMAHTIYSAEQAKKGSFVDKPTISSSPASILLRKT